MDSKFLRRPGQAPITVTVFSGIRLSGHEVEEIWNDKQLFKSYLMSTQYLPPSLQNIYHLAFKVQYIR